MRRRQALFWEFRNITSAPHLPLLHDLPQNCDRLRSRKPPLRLASQLVEMEFSPSTSWTTSWNEFNGQNKFLVQNPANVVCGMSLNRKEWTLLNRFRTGVGRCNYWQCKWGLTPDQSCDCGADVQTMAHIVNECPLRRFQEGLASLHNVSESGLELLCTLDLALWREIFKFLLFDAGTLYLSF